MSRARVAPVVALAVMVGVGGIALAREKAKAKKGKKGRVVRVERASGGRNLVPRLCSQVQTTGEIYCWGMTVEPGEVAQIYDDTGRKAEVRIDTATPQFDSCQNTVGWTLTSTVLEGSLQTTTYYGYMYAVFDWRGSSQTRTLINNGQIQVPPGRAGESVLAALDDDNDDQADLLVTYYQCDTSGNVAGYGSGAYCLVYYEGGVGSSFKELRVDIVRNCY